MKKMLAAIAIALCATAIAFAGGRQEPESRSRRDREAPRLDVAQPNPVDDINGYVVRTAAHWPGPERGTINGDFVLDAWEPFLDQYNIEREWIQTPNPMTTLEKMTATVLLGEPFADVVWISGSDAIPNLAKNNLILPLDEYIDFDDPRFPPNLDPVTTYKGTHYGVIPWILAPGSGMWYNRTLFQREGLPDPIDLIESGEWTWDTFLELAKQTTRDTDGDGEIDQWGLTIGYEIEYPLVNSNGAEIVKDLGNGEYRFALDDPDAIEALEFISEIYDANVVSYESEPLFIAGRAAMYGGELFQGNNMLINMEDEYGYVYYPKGPAVDEYRSYAGPGVMMVFPANLNFPPDLLGEIVTAITPFEEMKAIQSEFIEGQLRTARDIEMVREMIDNTIYHIGTGNFPGLRQQVGRVFRDVRNGASPATAVAQYRQPAQAAIDAVVE